jgi:mRNA-degrading endonuclease RelE of RelBE toxin-antitoxin system
MGDHRIICYIDDEKHTIRIMHLGHRKDVYDISSWTLNTFVD